jgi:Protein of unknown function (DUF3617)
MIARRIGSKGRQQRLPRVRRRERHVKSSLTNIIAALVLALVAAQAADAQTAIKPGKWEYTVTMQMPKMPQLPPGVQLPPNVQMQQGPGGMSITHTSCMKDSDPTAELRRPRGPQGSAEGQCKVERLQRNGATISWASTCTTPQATVHTEGSAHYNGDRMEANFTTRTTHASGSPIQVSQHVNGRYVGPCDEK